MLQGPRWSRNEGGPCAHATGGLMITKGRRPPRPCGRGLGGPSVKRPRRPCDGELNDPEAEEAPPPMQWGPWWS